MVQRKFCGFLHSFYETSLRLFHVPVPRSCTCTKTNRRPVTIDGYRTAIVDTLGPAGLYISQSSDLNGLLSSFHTDRPKSSRNLPKWNLSVVLNELTKAPFEPMKDTDLNHLTLKTAFLQAWASSKRCSEIIQVFPQSHLKGGKVMRFSSPEHVFIVVKPLGLYST